MSNIVIRVENLGKLYRLGQFVGYNTLRESLVNVITAPFRRFRSEPGNPEYEHIWALKNVTFEVKQGEVVGIIGRNGSGKTTLLKVLSRITNPTEGYAEIYGRVGSLLEVGTGFHPELTGKENIYLNGAVLGMKKKDIDRKFDEIVEFAGVEKFIDTPLKRYSTGMQVRLAFAVAAHLEPEILLVDEVLAVGDTEFQKKCLGKMGDIARGGRTVLFVSHNMGAIRRLCHRVILLDDGKVVADGSTEEVINTYLQSGVEIPAERVWEDIRQAPGDDVCRLRAVRVRDASGNTVDTIDVREMVGIETEYSISRANRWPVTIVHFFNDEGLHLFGSHNLSYKPSDSILPLPCVVREVCWIPGNLLAEGRIVVNVAISDFSPVLINHAVAREVVAFDVVDCSDVSCAMWPTTGRWPGVVRPILKWDVELIGKEAAN